MKIKYIVLWSVFAGLATAMLYCYIFYDNCVFFARFVWQPKHTGSVIPTSQTAAMQLIQPMLQKKPPRTILEVGAGTGPVTQEIVKQLHSDDQFDVLELDPVLCDLLREKFKAYTQVVIHCTPVEQWQPAYEYDIIISTVPFSNLTVEQIKPILHQFEQLAKPGAVLSYLEYIWGTELKKLFAQNEQAITLQEKVDLLKNFRDTHKTKTVSVMTNVPPTYVHHIEIGTSVAQAA